MSTGSPTLDCVCFSTSPARMQRALCSGRSGHQRRHLLVALRDVQRAPRRERAARRSSSRGGRVPRDADQAAAAGEAGDRSDEAARVRVRRGLEQLVGESQLDDAAGVHDRDSASERGDDGEVMADVERAHSVCRGELAHGVEHGRLRRDVEAGRGLVEDDQTRPVCERHRQADALLLAAGQLVRVAAQVLRDRRTARPRASSPRSARRGRLGVGLPVSLKHFAELEADPQRRVERRRGILRDVRHEVAAQPAQLGRRSCPRMSSSPSMTVPPVMLQAAPRVAEERQSDGRLAGPGLADETEHLARPRSRTRGPRRRPCPCWSRSARSSTRTAVRAAVMAPAAAVGIGSAVITLLALGRCQRRCARCRRRSGRSPW